MTVTIDLDVFNELKRALSVAIKFRKTELSNVEGKEQTEDYRKKLSKDFNVWFELECLLGSNLLEKRK